MTGRTSIRLVLACALLAPFGLPAHGAAPQTSSHEVSVLEELLEGPVEMSSLLDGIARSIESSFKSDGFLAVGSDGGPRVDDTLFQWPQVSRISNAPTTDLVVINADTEGAHMRRLHGRTGEPLATKDIAGDIAVIAVDDPCRNSVSFEMHLDDDEVSTEEGEIHWVEAQQTIVWGNCTGYIRRSATITGRALIQHRGRANPYTDVHAIHEMVVSINQADPDPRDISDPGGIAVLTATGGYVGAYDIPEVYIGLGDARYAFKLRMLDHRGFWFDYGDVRFPPSYSLQVIDLYSPSGGGTERGVLVLRHTYPTVWLELWTFGPSGGPGIPLWTRTFPAGNPPTPMTIPGMTVPRGSLEPVAGTDVLSTYSDLAGFDLTKVDGVSGLDEWSVPRGDVYLPGDLDGDGNDEVATYGPHPSKLTWVASVFDGESGAAIWATSFGPGKPISGPLPKTASGETRWVSFHWSGADPSLRGVRAFDIRDGSPVWDVRGTFSASVARGHNVAHGLNVADAVLLRGTGESAQTGQQLRDTEDGALLWRPPIPNSYDSVYEVSKLADVDLDGSLELAQTFRIGDEYQVRLSSDAGYSWTLALPASP